MHLVHQNIHISSYIGYLCHPVLESMQLLSANRQIRHEARGLFYAENKFIFRDCIKNRDRNKNRGFLSRFTSFLASLSTFEPLPSLKPVSILYDSGRSRSWKCKSTCYMTEIELDLVNASVVESVDSACFCSPSVGAPNKSVLHELESVFASTWGGPDGTRAQHVTIARAILEVLPEPACLYF